jgi:hypothetical protein
MTAQIIPFRPRPKPPAAMTEAERTEFIRGISATLIATQHPWLRDVADSWRVAWGDDGAPLIQTELPAGSVKRHGRPTP